MPLTPYPYPALNACAQIRAILDLPVLVVLDEAYIEFSEVPSKLKWVQQYNNLVVLRTFSKSAGEWKVLDGVNGEQGCPCSNTKRQHVGYSFWPGAEIECCSMPPLTLPISPALIAPLPFPAPQPWRVCVWATARSPWT